MDRISQLPDFIVHHILSFVKTPEELVRMSVLSKNWFDLTASFPILEFSMGYFRSRQSFFKYMDYTTSRFCLQNVIAHKFKLIAALKEPAELEIINRCLEFVLRKGIRELVIKIFGVYSAKPLPKYCLPNIRLSVPVLKSLIICGCQLPSSFIYDAVKLKSLIRLEFINLYIDDEAIECLTARCPLLQEFYIKRCHGFKRFCVYGHQNLQTVRLYYNTALERIDIEAPNLSSLAVYDMLQRGTPPMNLGSCKKLTTVNYVGHPLSNSNCYFLSNFPFIQRLVLATNYKGKNLNLSSHSLRTLVLHSDFDLKDIEFSLPNLVFFIYSGKHRLWITDKLLTFLVDKTSLKACMHCYPDVCMDAFWFHKLRLFLDNKNGFKVLNLYIHIRYSQKLTELEKLKAIELPPYELEHVELQLDTHKESSAHVAFVDAVLWCCRPRSLTLRPSFPSTDFEYIVKFTYAKLLEQVDQGHSSIQIVWPSSSKAQKQFRDLKSLSMALPCDEKAITFIKEQVLQEAAESKRFTDMDIF